MAMLGEVLKNPGQGRSSEQVRSGAYLRGRFLKVTLREPGGREVGYSPMGPWGFERGSMAYRQVMESAGTVKAAFDEMIEGVRRG